MVRSAALALLITSLLASAAKAALPAYDNAADPAYANGWIDGSNGGFGFNPWVITTNNDNTEHFAGTFIGDANASGVNGGIDTDGKAFGMYSNTSGNTSGASVDAMRDFTGGALSAGQSFSLQIGVNYRDGGKGIILNGGGQILASFFIGGFPQEYALNVQGTDPQTYSAAPFRADSLFTVTFTMDTAIQLTAHLTRTSNAGFEDLATLTTTLTGALPDGFNLFYGSTAQYYPQDDLFFNNFAVTNAAIPEPSTLGLLASGAALGLLRFLRRGPRRGRPSE